MSPGGYGWFYRHVLTKPEAGSAMASVPNAILAVGMHPSTRNPGGRCSLGEAVLPLIDFTVGQ